MKLAGQWQAYLTRAKSVDEIKRRLAEVPEKLRERVRSHAKLVWRLRNG